MRLKLARRQASVKTVQAAVSAPMLAQNIGPKNLVLAVRVYLLEIPNVTVEPCGARACVARCLAESL